MIDIMVIDEQELVRSGISSLLDNESHFRVVAETGDEESAVHLARQHAPGVVIMSTEPTGMSAVELARRLLRGHPAPKILALSSARHGPLPDCLLELGVSGFLTRHCRREELVAAVRQVHGGGYHVSAEVAHGLVLDRIHPERAPLDCLSPRELAVMILVSQGHDRRHISRELSVSPKTVSTYRCRVMRKLGATSDVQLIHLSFQHGLITPESAVH